MKNIEIVIAGTLIVAGLLCLSMAPSAMMGSHTPFIHSLLTVCLWTAIPLVVIGLLYVLFLRKKK